jgi:hypothetical protein
MLLGMIITYIMMLLLAEFGLILIGGGIFGLLIYVAFKVQSISAKVNKSSERQERFE